MQMRLTLVDPGCAGRQAEVAVTAGPDTPVSSIRGLLLDALRAVHPPRADSPTELDLFVDGRPLDGGHVLGAPPLVNGALLTVGRPGADPGRAGGRVGGFLELHVVGGPDAGQVHRLTPGDHTLGRVGEATLRIDDPDCSRVHARLTVAANGVLLHDLDSTNGTWVDGQRLGATGVQLSERSRIRIGSSSLRLRVPGGTPAAGSNDNEGYVWVNRSPRMVPPVQPVEIRLPTRPEPRRSVRVPLLALVLPLVVAVPMALFWSPVTLLFALMTPVMMLGNLFSDKTAGRRQYRREMRSFEAAEHQARERLKAALDTEVLRRESAAPDAAELLQIATGPLQRLWERRRTDDDLLRLRVGTATVPSMVSVVDPAATEPFAPEIEDVPVCLRLCDVGVLGIAGRRERVSALVRFLLAQVVTLHSPRDVALVVLAAGTDGVAGLDWSSAAWFPHTSPTALSDAVPVDAAGPGGLAPGSEALVGATAEQVRRRVAELVAELDRRLELSDRTASTGRAPAGDRVNGWHGTRFVVLLDGAQRLRAVPGVSRLLEEGPDVGICLICLDDDQARLPVECRGTVQLSGEVGTRLRVSLAGQAPIGDVVADLTSATWLERLARGLAPLRDATPDAAVASVPASARLLDLIPVEGIDPTDEVAVARGWLRSPRSTTALLGAGAAGPYRVDLRRDGPHVLIGGTTGSGKSELLQTLIASLAIGNRPDEMGFVLVDYKGGSAFADCGRLPHTLGVVTDLDDDLTGRALESLTAEVTRREKLLASHGVKDLEDYQLLVDAGRDAGRDTVPRLGRLVLVIDEFRVLAEELPAFLDGLVRIAAVGRSLGIHLVLATQRPAGVVSADIKANVNLRIALRVRDVADSLDVIDARDAAGITERTPGRAIARSGSNPLVEFQSARVGGRATAGGVTPVAVRRTSWATLGEPPVRPPTVPHTAGPTDLARVVDALVGAAGLAGVRPAASPWLPPLPAVVAVDALCGKGSDSPTTVPIGLLDDPARQRQVPAVVDLATGGCLAVAGGARSGRSSLLRTLAVSAALRLSPADLSIYVLDGGGALAPLADLPQVGAVVPRDDTDRTARLLRRLAEEVARRQQVLAAGGFADVGEQRAATASVGTSLAHVLLLVDGWEALQQAHEDLDAGRALDTVEQLVRLGPGVGIITVIGGERAVLSGRLGGSIPERVVLRLADPTDAVLAGVPARAVPAHLPPGRGLRVGRDGMHLLQVALLAEDTTGAAQQLALATTIRRLRERAATVPPERLPFEVPAMPDRVDLDTVLATRKADGAGGAGWLALGLGGDDVRPLWIDPAVDGRCIVVAGHPGAGRTSTLRTLTAGLLGSGTPVALVSLSPAMPSDPHTEPLLGFFTTGQGADLLAALDASRADGHPAAVVVDDADQLDGGPLEPALLAVLQRLAVTGELLVMAGSSPQLVGRYHGVTAAARKACCGILLGPASTLDGDVFGVRTPRRAEYRPGRGLLIRRGRLTAVQIALPPGSVGPDT